MVPGCAGASTSATGGRRPAGDGVTSSAVRLHRRQLGGADEAAVARGVRRTHGALTTSRGGNLWRGGRQLHPPHRGSPAGVAADLVAVYGCAPRSMMAPPGADQWAAIQTRDHPPAGDQGGRGVTGPCASGSTQSHPAAGPHPSCREPCARQP